MHRTTITLTVLSEQEIPFGMELSDIIAEADDGDYVMTETRQLGEKLTGKEMADALYEAGSDPGFFNLNDSGDLIEEGS